VEFAGFLITTGWEYSGRVSTEITELPWYIVLFCIDDEILVDFRLNVDDHLGDKPSYVRIIWFFRGIHEIRTYLKNNLSAHGCVVNRFKMLTYYVYAPLFNRLTPCSEL
jgi:hypothetical protein